MFNDNAGITLVKHVVVRLIQLPLSLHGGVRLAKQKTEHKEKPEPFFDCKRQGEKADKIFLQGECSSRPHRGWTRGRKAQKKQTYRLSKLLSALQPGHLSSYLLMCSSTQTPFNRALHKGGDRNPFKRISIALPVSAGQGSAWNDVGGYFRLLCKSSPCLDLGRLC